MLSRNLMSAGYLAVALVCVATLPAWSYTGTLALVAISDNTLFENEGGALSNGKGDHFFAGRTSQFSDSIRRGLLAFDVAVVPTGSTIDSVAVTLHMSRTLIQDSPQAIGLHRCNGAWGEGSSEALGEEGQGAPATTGDATWVHRFFDTQLWASPGGDFEVLPSASVTVDSIDFYTWTSPALASDVQAWLNDPNSNLGWTVLGNEDAAATTKRFDSKDHDSTGVRPVLFVRFTTATDVGLPARTARLHPNFPNPFNPGTRILYELAEPGRALVRVYDVSGRAICTLVDAQQEAGEHIISWDGTDNDGSRLASGVYLYMLRTADAIRTRRMLLLR